MLALVACGSPSSAPPASLSAPSHDGAAPSTTAGASDAASSDATSPIRNLDRARAAAIAFARRFEFTATEIDRLAGPSLGEPIVLERDSDTVEVFRWLGNGRGQPIVQVEISRTTGEVTVYGGYEHREFGPWHP